MIATERKRWYRGGQMTSWGNRLKRSRVTGVMLVSTLLCSCFPYGHTHPAVADRGPRTAAVGFVLPIRSPLAEVYSNPGYLGSIGLGSRLLLTAEEIDSTTAVVFRVRAPGRARSLLDSPVLAAQRSWGAYDRFFTAIGPNGEPALGARPTLLAGESLLGAIEIYKDPGVDITALPLQTPILVGERNHRGDIALYNDISSAGRPRFGARPILITEDDGVGLVKVYNEIGFLETRAALATPVLAVRYRGTLDPKLLTILLLLAL